MTLRTLTFLVLPGTALVTSLLVPAWAGEALHSPILLNVSTITTCHVDANTLAFDLGTVDTPHQEASQTQVVRLTCDAPAKVTLLGTLKRSSQQESTAAGGEIPSLQGCENGGQGSCFDLKQAGHTFDVPAAGADVGIKVRYQAPDGVGTDTFTGQLTLTWP